MAFQGPCQQASFSSLCLQTTRTACVKESEFAVAGQPRKPAFLNGTAVFLLQLKTEKHAFSFSPTPFKCFLAGPLNELQGFAAEAELGSLS
ncbi:hypothetical protein ACRRTK_012946 [Alexandromys fortis]